MGVKYSVFVNSGSSANLVALLSLKEKYNLQDGDEVIIETDSSSGPGVFRSDSNPGYTHVVMPMFVQW